MKGAQGNGTLENEWKWSHTNVALSHQAGKGSSSHFNLLNISFSIGITHR